MPALLLALLLLTSPATSPAAQPSARVVAELPNLRALPTGWARTRAASGLLLGLPYAHSPLGEGRGIDTDPRIRFDAVDCLTFVETALALGHATTLDEATRVLDDVRYRDGDAPSFSSRLHIMEAQWIPSQIAKGYLRDVTRRFGGSAVREQKLLLTPRAWSASAKFRAMRADAPTGTFSLPMIPLERARAIASTLPEGLVLSVMREPMADRLTATTHVGLIVIRAGVRYVRHARLSDRKVVDEELATFLARHARMKRRKVTGIHLLEVLDNRARASRLHSSQPIADSEP